jgi:hypothetical protein
MADKELRKLEREAANDPAAERRLQAARVRSGILKFVWMLQYTSNSVGLDGSLVGIFTTRQACVDHIKKHEKHFRPGLHTKSPSSFTNRKYDESFNNWTNGYRGLVIKKVPIHEEPTDDWWAAHKEA